MTRLARLSLANRSLVIMIALVLAGVGAFMIPQLKQQLFPSLELPMVTVVAPYSGASPDIVEDQVTDPIESSLEGLADVEEVTSASSEGSSRVTAAFDFEADLDDSVSEVEDAVSTIENDLPEDVETSVAAGGTDDLPVMTLAVSNGKDKNEAGLLDKLEKKVVPELESISDVQNADVTGARPSQVTITPDTDELEKAGLTSQSITDALAANGVPVPAGTVTDDGQNLSVQVGEKLSSVGELEDIYLTSPAGAGGQPGGGAGGGAGAAPEPVQLDEVADVEQEPEEASSLTRTNGEKSLGVSVTMTSEGNAVSISHEIHDKLDTLKQSLGDNDKITVTSDQAPAVEKSVEDLTTEGGLGLLFAVLVIMVFLLSLRSTIVTAMSIPMSVVIALIALWVGDYSLNMLTLGALTISVGRVVDDSIVVLENIKRHLSYGEHKREAVIKGVREVAGAVTSSTLTTVAVFLPIAFVSGMVGQLFSSFAVTVTVALLASLLVSLTLIPVLAYWFLKAPKGGDAQRAQIRERAEQRELRSPLQRAYVPVLRFATRFKFVTIVIGVAVFAGTIALIPGLKTNFMDSTGQDTTSVSQTLPAGTDLDTTDKAAGKVEDVLEKFRADGDIADYQANVGGGNAMFAGLGLAAAEENKANYNITVTDASKTPKVEDALRDEFEDLSDAGDVTVGMQANQAMGGEAVEVVVHGDDIESLEKASERVETEMEDVDGLRDVSSNLSDAMPRIQVDVDEKKAAKAGLSEAAVGQFVAQQVEGAPAGDITIEGQNNDIVMSGEDTLGGLSDVEGLEITTASGQKELSDLADVSEVEGPVEISHTDGDRTATVSAAADAEDLGGVTATLDETLRDVDLPSGTDYEIAGTSQDQEEAFADLGLAMLVAIALVFMIMVATFRSFAQPLVLLVSIPFAATGAIGMLLATDVPLGVAGMIGLLMLIGIVVTNAIVLIDLINQYRQQGMEIREAVIAGGRRRLRPILMTAVATICALIPMALGLTGSGGFIAQSLAIVVIGGLVSSTILTLLLVPTLYVIVERIKQRFSRDRQPGADGADDSVDESAAPA